MDIGEWLANLSGGESLRDIAAKADTSKSTLSRQVDKGRFTPEMVIALCRGYDRSPVTGLVETGYIEPWETEGVSIPYALQEATNQQLLDEIVRRSDPEARELFTGAGADVVDIDESAEVYQLPSRQPIEADLQAVDEALTSHERQLVDAGKAPDLYTLADLDAWHKRRAGRGGGSATPFDTGESYAADSSPDEDALREEYGEDPID